jgi:hypothetical protein
MNPQLKIKPYRSKKYLAFVRSHGCIVCGKPAEAHHVRRSYWGAGTAIKPHDYVTIPLCRDCHKPKTEKELDVERIIISLLMEYIEK